MRILVACEFSATVRDAFRKAGHDAWSVDIIPTEGDPTYHIQGDAIERAYGERWGMMVAFPPCTHLALSGARWWPEKLQEQAEALEFVRTLMAAPIPRIAIENPVGKINSTIRKPDQIVQPWQFGHGEVKATCLWLKGLPLLEHTDIVDGRHPRIHRVGPQKNRWKIRSRTYAGIAAAMASQWGSAADRLTTIG